MARMSIHTGISADLKRVSITMLADGNQLGWLELDAEGADNLIENIKRFRDLLQLANTFNPAQQKVN